MSEQFYSLKVVTFDSDFRKKNIIGYQKEIKFYEMLKKNSKENLVAKLLFNEDFS
jgi:hypothetical protein